MRFIVVGSPGVVDIATRSGQNPETGRRSTTRRWPSEREIAREVAQEQGVRLRGRVRADDGRDGQGQGEVRGEVPRRPAADGVHPVAERAPGDGVRVFQGDWAATGTSGRSRVDLAGEEGRGDRRAQGLSASRTARSKSRAAAIRSASSATRRARTRPAGSSSSCRSTRT